MKHHTMNVKTVFMLVAILLGGCYVQENPPENPKADPEKAVYNYVKLGLEYLALGETQQAKAPLKRAIEINPNSAEANGALALLYQHDAEPALAETYFKKAIEIKPGFTTGRNNYGMFLYSQGRYDEALAQLKIASDDTLYNKRAQIFYNMGVVYLKMNKSAEADAAFNKSKILDGGNPETYLEIAHMSFDNGEYTQAAEAYRTYVQLKPQQDARGLWLGIRLAKVLGKKDEEINYAQQLKTLYPTSEEYFTYMNSKGK